MAIIERLASHHDRQGFDCGNAELNRFLTRYAGQHDERGYGRTYVLTDGSAKVLGFYTLSAGAVGFENVSEEILRKLPRHAMPVIHLGRMDVAKEEQGKGWGAMLLVDALKRSLLLADGLGIHAVEVVAKNEQAKDFYLKYGFKPLKDDLLHLYLPVKTIRKLDL